MAAGFGLGSAAASEPQSQDSPAEQVADSSVRGQVMQQVSPETVTVTPLRIWAGLLGMLA